MSINVRQSIVDWDKVEAKLRKAHYVRDGLEVSPRDTETWAFSLRLLGNLVHDLTLYASPNAPSIAQWCFTLSTVDVALLLRTFKVCDQLIVRHMSGDARIADYRDFEGHVSASMGKRVACCYIILKRDIIDVITRYDVERFSQLHQVFCFIAKVSLKDIPDTGLEEEYIRRDQELTNAHPLVASLNRIVREWFTGFSVFHYPRHSGGTTIDAGRSLEKKCKSVGTDQLLRYVLKDKDFPSFVVGKDPGVHRMSKLLFVPKNGLTRRIICCEPATLQFWQHAVQQSMYAWFQWHREMHIPILNQEINAEFAKRGAISGTIATVDLSAASDYVSWDLVKHLFAGTSVLPWLFAVRSREVLLPSGRILRLKKHAPMGSAVCFPVMCVVFAAMCEWVKRSHWNARGYNMYTVYGDDIACHAALVPGVLAMLREFGFVTNEAKTFTLQGGTTYRESCGKEYLGARDVTPLRLSTKFSGVSPKSLAPEEVPALLDVCNSAFKRGYLSVRRAILARLLTLPPDLVPPFGDEPGRLLTLSESNWSHRKRCNIRLQRCEVRAGQLCSKRAPIPATADISEGRIVPPLKPTELSSDELLSEEARYVLYWIWSRGGPLQDRVNLCSETAVVWSSRWLPAIGFAPPLR